MPVSGRGYNDRYTNVILRFSSAHVPALPDIAMPTAQPASPAPTAPALLTAAKLVPQGRRLAPVLLKRAARVALDWDTRSKSRFDAVDSQGRRLGVFLPRGSVIRGGDVLVAEDGSLVVVEAAAQPLLRVQPCAAHGSPFDLLRAAYHLGNRHVVLELQPQCLQFEPDPVLADLLRAMHLEVAEVQAPFEPEGGAYATHGHGHKHNAAHDHADHHAQAPGSSHDHHGHTHGPHCRHDHGH
jgi:urease accessory protein